MNMGEFYGSSYIVNPRGTIEAQASYGDDELLVHEIDLDMVREVRDTWQFFPRSPAGNLSSADRELTSVPLRPRPNCPPRALCALLGEHIELDLGQDLASSPRYNDDIAPTRAEVRTWNRWHVASLWGRHGHLCPYLYPRGCADGLFWPVCHRSTVDDPYCQYCRPDTTDS